MFYGITFNNKHSYNDYGITIKSKDLTPPEKITYEDSVPGMNGSYDFTDLYGGPNYPDRELIYTFNIDGNSKEEMTNKKIAVVDWLMKPNKRIELYDDVIKGLHFIAECKSTSFTEKNCHGELTCKFKGYPLKVGNNYEGNLLWDDINFDLPDYIQETNFDVSGSKTITLYLNGVNIVVPEVVVATDMSCTLNSYTANFTATVKQDDDFILKPGVNEITINGTGNITFNFRKEVL